MTLWLPLGVLWLLIVLVVFGACHQSKRADELAETHAEQWARESNEYHARYEDRQRLGV